MFYFFLFSFKKKNMDKNKYFIRSTFNFKSENIPKLWKSI